jgi:hypothetical protein
MYSACLAFANCSVAVGTLLLQMALGTYVAVPAEQRIEETCFRVTEGLSSQGMLGVRGATSIGGASRAERADSKDKLAGTTGCSSPPGRFSRRQRCCNAVPRRVLTLQVEQIQLQI